MNALLLFAPAVFVQPEQPRRIVDLCRIVLRATPPILIYLSPRFLSIIIMSDSGGKQTRFDFFR